MKVVFNKDTGVYQPESFIMPRNVESVDWAGHGKLGTMIVPDYICGVSIKKSACIHDWMYKYGKTWKEKRQADRVFKKNLLIQTKNCDLLLRASARATVSIYYYAVKLFGEGPYWSGKVKPKKSWLDELLTF